MAMENTGALSTDAVEAVSSASKLDSSSLGSGVEQQGSDYATQQSSAEESLPQEKPKDALDPEGDFVDAEAIAEDGKMAAPTAMNVNSRAPKGTEVADVVDDDESGSVESFDSALERIAVASTGDPASPEGPSSPAFEPAETSQQIALRQLNQMNSGVSSLDTVLLENVSPAEFKTRVTQIAQKHGFSADSGDVEQIVSVLLPLVEGEEDKSVKDAVDVDTEGVDNTNVLENKNSSQVEASANVQAEALEVYPKEVIPSQDVDDDASTAKNSSTTKDAGDDFSKPADSLEESFDVKAGGDSMGDGNAEIRVSEINDYEPEPEVIDWDDLNESDADDSSAQPPLSAAENSKDMVDGATVESAGLPQETRTPNAVGQPAISAVEDEENEASKSEPEADLPVEYERKVQHVDVNGEEPRGSDAFKVQELSSEVEDLGKLEAGNQTGSEQPGNAKEGDVNAADRGLNKLEAGELAESEQAVTPVNAKEVDANIAEGSSEVEEAQDKLICSGDPAGIEKEALVGSENYENGETYERSHVVEEQSTAEVAVETEEVEPKLREFEVEGKADETYSSSEQATAKADNAVVLEEGARDSDAVGISEEGALESKALGAYNVSEDLGDGRELSTTQVSDLKDSKTLDPKLSSEVGGLSKREESAQESPVLDVASDVSVEGGDSVLENATPLPAVVELNNDKNTVPPTTEKPADVSLRKEEADDEKPSLVAAGMDSKSASGTGNDAASSLGGAGPSLPVRPAGLGRSVPSLEHAPRAVQRSSGVPAAARQVPPTEENGSSTEVTEGSDDAREKLQMIRVKFLRLANRLGQSAHNVVVAQVLYRLGLAEQLRGGRGAGRTGAFAFERASVLAEEQEAAGGDDLEFGCTIMVLGKSGVGKSATINSLFDEVKSGTNAYGPATNKVQEIIGTVHGIKLRVIDTPGLLTSFADQRRNERIMSSVKRFIKKSPPDIVLYFDRLDMQSRDYGDLPLLRTITDTFGSAVWFNAIVVLTHASSAPPDGANGVPVSYEMFVAQRSHVVQQTIRQAAGDMRLMNPVSLVENHAACRRNRAGERVLPNGQVWKPQLLLLCFASKILAEANSLLKLQDNSPAKPFGVRSKVPPLPFLLSSLLQSRAQLKLPDEQMGSDDESEDESDEEADSEGEEEYDDLPPFRRLTKDELKLLDKEQRRVYAEELEYREKLFMKKQLKDERARKKELKRRLAALPKEVAQFAEESLEEENASASVPVPMPDMALPPSFDADNPSYRYRYLDTANQWLVRPVLETHGWDHDSGYDGLNVEKMFVLSKKIPVSVSGQVTKDKKEANLQMECAASFKNGKGKFTQAGLDIQTIGKDLAYTLRSETRFDNFKRNKTTCGLAVTLLGDTLAAGMKIEDRLFIGKRVKLVFNGGALTGRGDVAYGGSLEATIRDKDYPIGQFLSTFGLSVMDWHGDLAIGGNLQVQCKLGKTMTIVRGNLNNRKAGQISVRVSNSEQLQIALIGLIPLIRTFINNRILSSN